VGDTIWKCSFGNHYSGSMGRWPLPHSTPCFNRCIVYYYVIIIVVATLYTANATILFFNRFYRAKRSVARLCHDKLSVRPFVRLSVTLVDSDHTCWNSSKIISWLISLTFLLSIDSNITEQRNFSRIRSRMGKIVDFRHLSRRISETVQDEKLLGGVRTGDKHSLCLPEFKIPLAESCGWRLNRDDVGE